MGIRHTDMDLLILTVLSIVTGGRLNVVGGSNWMYLYVVLAFFCVLWGVMSYDDAKTNQKYKISGICINIVAIFIGITFIMM
ncbi:MAG: hypothetical protein ACLVIY_08285 [Anaerobutyricum soehngenii]